MIPENIKTACLTAENPGECEYSKGCVIQKLAELHNGCLKEYDYSKEISSIDHLLEIQTVAEMLKDYRANSLKDLQKFWDDADKNLEKPNKVLLEFAETLDW